MKAKGAIPRLYMTTPDAYTQSRNSGWTWQLLRQLPCAQAASTEADEVYDDARGSAGVSCWTHHSNLDGVVAADQSSTIASRRQARWSEQTGPMAEDSHDHGSVDSFAIPTSPITEEQHARAIRLRTDLLADPDRCLSSSVGANSKRRSSLPDQTRENNKRRRTSISSNIGADGALFTPRRSREPPSPFLSDSQGDTPSQNGGSPRRRGNTPFAYATPHSNTTNTTAVAHLLGEGEDGDTEADTEVGYHHDLRADMEWEGMVSEGMPSSPLVFQNG